MKATPTRFAGCSTQGDRRLRGASADAFALLERFEAKLKDFQGSVHGPPRSWPRMAHGPQPAPVEA